MSTPAFHGELGQLQASLELIAHTAGLNDTPGSVAQARFNLAGLKTLVDSACAHHDIAAADRIPPPALVDETSPAFSTPEAEAKASLVLDAIGEALHDMFCVRAPNALSFVFCPQRLKSWAGRTYGSLAVQRLKEQVAALLEAAQWCDGVCNTLQDTTPAQRATETALRKQNRWQFANSALTPDGELVISGDRLGECDPDDGTPRYRYHILARIRQDGVCLWSRT